MNRRKLSGGNVLRQSGERGRNPSSGNVPPRSGVLAPVGRNPSSGNVPRRPDALLAPVGRTRARRLAALVLAAADRLGVGRRLAPAYLAAVLGRDAYRDLLAEDALGVELHPGGRLELTPDAVARARAVLGLPAVVEPPPTPTAPPRPSPARRRRRGPGRSTRTRHPRRCRPQRVRVLLDVIDAAHCLGLRVERFAWEGRFRPQATPAAAARAWERFKASLSAEGVAHSREGGAVVLERGELARLAEELEGVGR